MLPKEEMDLLVRGLRGRQVRKACGGATPECYLEIIAAEFHDSSSPRADNGSSEVQFYVARPLPVELSACP